MNSPQQISVQEVAQRLSGDSPPALLDIREQSEWEIVRLPSAVLATDAALEEVLRNWEREREIVCYCHHGVRSLQAAGFLMQRGFTNVKSMAGGIDAYSREVDSALPRY